MTGGTSEPRTADRQGGPVPPGEPGRLGRADGRVERGRQRRALLLAAALRVVERDGVAALTHRSVAREAGLADTSGTYYFRTVDELLVAASTAGAERFAAAVRSVSGITELAELASTYLHEHRGRAIAEYELYLLAARRPELRPAAHLWLTAARELLATWTADETALRAALAACDGLLLQGLITDAPPTAEQIAATLTHLLTARTV